MKTVFTFLISCLLVGNVFGQAGQWNWTWMKGDTTINKRGIYGTRSTAAAANKPGARFISSNWTGNFDNFWLFGGTGQAATKFGRLNDLWRYNRLMNEWTWVKGDSTVDIYSIYGTKGFSAATNNPGGRHGSATWSDTSNSFWLFGGYGLGVSSLGFLNDLWNYNASINQWTWVNGNNLVNKYGVYGIQGTAAAANSPGSRQGSVTWTDAFGIFWLFGGIGYSANSGGTVYSYLNDLWKYDASNNQWTWVSGDNTCNSSGIYGTQGTAAATNKPGARAYAVSWMDASGNFWLYGGSGYAASSPGYLNDLWKYSSLTNQWTWVKGDSTVDESAVYGSQGTPALINKPGARAGSLSWTDDSNNLLLFGGTGMTATSSGDLHDLWRYNSSTNEWAWLRGDSITPQLAVFGLQGIADSANQPGGRDVSVGWRDTTGGIWIFGGRGNSSDTYGYLNDLWKYTSDNSTLPVHLLTFTAKQQNENINLNWQVENEQSFDRYEVERSTNGREFNKIGAVKAIGAKEYSLVDHWALSVDRPSNNEQPSTNNVLYYRLKMLDRDGKFTYSKVETVKISNDTKFTIYPNPAHSQIQLQLSKTIAGKVDIEIADVNGKVVYHSSFGSQSSVINRRLSISTNKLTTGTYSVKMIYNNEEYVQQVVVVK